MIEWWNGRVMTLADNVDLGDVEEKYLKSSDWKSLPDMGDI